MKHSCTRFCGLSVAALLLVACADGPKSAPNSELAAGGYRSNPLHADGPSTYDIFAPVTALAAGAAGMAGSGGGGASGGGAGGSAGLAGSAGAAPLSCTPQTPTGTPPTTAVCGDGFVTGTEQCDDNNTANGDACSSTCVVTPLLVTPRTASTTALPLPGRELGFGRHPMAAGCNTFGLAFLDQSTLPGVLKLAQFSNLGSAKAVVSFGSGNVDSPSPSLAALPDDTFVAAWTDLDSDELGVALRRITPSAMTQPAAGVANMVQDFSQRDPEVVFSGNQVIVAWVDDTDPFNGPDIRYRTFAPDLTPTSGDLTLAATNAVEGDVALAALGSSWAAAWRSGLNGNETIEVQTDASVHWTIGPFPAGAPQDRPALAFIDATHLAVAYTQGPSLTESATHLYGALIDVAHPGQVTTAFAIAPTVTPYSSTVTVSQGEPALVSVANKLLVSWRSSLINGDVRADELWTRAITWSAGSGGALVANVSAAELPMLSTEALRAGDQSEPALLSVNLGRVVSAWQDYGKGFGATAGLPDVALHF